MDVPTMLSAAHDRIIDAELKTIRLERKIDATLAYLENLHGPFADPITVRALLHD